MKNRMKRISAVLMSCTMAISMSACGSSPESASDSVSTENDVSSESDVVTKDSGVVENDATAQSERDSGDKVITLWNGASQSPDKDVIEYMVNEFNNNTESGYTVENVIISGESYKEKLVVAMSAGECPDMYLHWSGGPMNEYIESGFAQPLDDLYEETGLIDEYMDGGLAQSTYDGKLYAVPVWNVSLSGILYNTEIFEKYGLEIPTTVSELESVCDILLENGVIPFALANAEKWTGSMFFMNLAARKGGLEPFQKAVAGTGTFEDECFVYAGEKIQEWVQKSYFPEGVNSLSENDSQSNQLMYQEKAAMKLTGSWDVGNYAADNMDFHDKIGWFPFPAVDGSDADTSIQIGTIGDEFISFNCTGEKLKAAFECATYLSSEGEKQLMAEASKITPTKDARDYVKDPIMLQVLTAAEKASAIQLWYDQYLPPAVAQVHLATCQEVFGMTMTPEEAAKEFQSAMEEYLADQE